MKKRFVLPILLTFLLAKPAFAEPLYSDPYTYINHLDAVAYVTELGVFSGFDDGTFRGADSVNRAQLAKTITLATGMTEAEVSECANDDDTPQFTDLNPDAWYVDYVYCAYLQGWIQGDTDSNGSPLWTFRPGDDVSLVEGLKMVVISQAGEPSSQYQGAAWFDSYRNVLTAHNILQEDGAQGELTSYTYNDYLLGSNGATSTKLQRRDIAELLYRVRIALDLGANNWADFDPFWNFNEDFLELINAHRAVNGAGPLQINEEMNAAAQGHSDWMAATQTASHTGENGSSHTDRCDDAGTWCMAENVAYNGNALANAQDFFRGWRDSEGHNINMLNSSFDYIGIGLRDGYATTVFR